MEDSLNFSDVLIARSPLLAVLWLWDLGRVLRELLRASPSGAELARCGLPRHPLPPAPLQRFLARRRIHASYPRGNQAR